MSDSVKNIKLIEVCDTWQGEGPNTGKQMLLVRFKDCNKKCPFCDTSIRMKTAHSGFYSIDDINAALERSKSIMITGGEPTFNDNFDQTKLLLKNCKYELANIETNGYNLLGLILDCRYLIDSTKIINYIWSPKFFTETEYSEAVQVFSHIFQESNLYIKIVVSFSSIERIESFLKFSNVYIESRSKIYLMVEGTTKDEINKNWDNCIELADKYNCNISSRLHIVHGFI